jgi:hypothetical protein
MFPYRVASIDDPAMDRVAARHGEEAPTFPYRVASIDNLATNRGLQGAEKSMYRCRVTSIDDPATDRVAARC